MSTFTNTNNLILFLTWYLNPLVFNSSWHGGLCVLHGWKCVCFAAQRELHIWWYLKLFSNFEWHIFQFDTLANVNLTLMDFVICALHSLAFHQLLIWSFILCLHVSHVMALDLTILLDIFHWNYSSGFLYFTLPNVNSPPMALSNVNSSHQRHFPTSIVPTNDIVECQ